MSPNTCVFLCAFIFVSYSLIALRLKVDTALDCLESLKTQIGHCYDQSHEISSVEESVNKEKNKTSSLVIVDGSTLSSREKEKEEGKRRRNSFQQFILSNERCDVELIEHERRERVILSRLEQLNRIRRQCEVFLTNIILFNQFVLFMNLVGLRIKYTYGKKKQQQLV